MLGLCGPSELARNDHPLFLERVRCDSIPTDRLPPRQPVRPTPTGEALAVALQGRLLRKLPLERVTVAKKVLPEITDLVMSFLTDDHFYSTTENGALCFATTRSLLLDFFFQAVPKESPSKESTERLQKLCAGAWAENPVVALKLIFHLGAARCGKQDRFGFYDALVWLWELSPGTVLGSLECVPDTNYWKALLELTARIAEGTERTFEREIVQHKAHVEKRPMLLQRDVPGYTGSRRNQIGWQGAGTRLANARAVLQKYDEDPLFRALLHQVAKLFAQQLAADLVAMRSQEPTSLAGKWAPKPYKSFDRRTLIAELIARELFPASLPMFAGLTERVYAYRARELYRHALNELREHKRIPERLMNAGRCREINYKTVPGACLARNSQLFMKLDRDRFMRFLQSDMAKKVGSMQPHELAKAAMGSDPIAAALAEHQWKALVVQTGTQLQNCIAVCDVSGSMCQPAAPNVTCMDVAIALSLLIAEIDGPGKDHVITFHSSPQLVTLRGKTLKQRWNEVRNLPWGMSTNFNRVFDLLIDMPIERIFCFSDMQFNDAIDDDDETTDDTTTSDYDDRDEHDDDDDDYNCAVNGQTNFQAAQAKYRCASKSLPELVFWNLESRGRGAPVEADTRGAVLVSGFSAALLKDVLSIDEDEEEEEMAEPTAKKPKKTKKQRTPMEVMCNAIDKPVFARLRVARDDLAVAEQILGARLALGSPAGLKRPALPEPLMTGLDSLYKGDVKAPVFLRRTSVARIADLIAEEVDKELEDTPTRGDDHSADARRRTRRVHGPQRPGAKRRALQLQRRRFAAADSRRRKVKARCVSRRVYQDAKYVYA